VVERREQSLSVRLWMQRHGPVTPIVLGLVTLLAATGILIMLIWGLVLGRPLTPGAFAVWVPVSVAGLILVAYEWSRWFFIGFTSIVVVLLLVLVVELGQTVNQVTNLADAHSTEQVLAIQLGRSEHVAAATQLKALASSVASPTSSTPGGDVGPSIQALSLDLQSVLMGKIAYPKQITALNKDQTRLTTALVAARAQPPATSSTSTTIASTTPQVSVDGSAISLRWWSYVSTANSSLQELCRLIGPPPTHGPVPTICPAGSAWKNEINPSPTPAELTQAVTPAISAVSAAVADVSPTAANASQAQSANSALSASFSTPPQNSANIASNISSGTNELVAYFERSLPGSSWWNTPLDLGAWIVLAILALLGLRLLLLLNNRNGWGPIEVALDSTTPNAKPDPGDLQRLAAIRSYVLENIPEPAAALGSNALSQITTLVTASSLAAPPWLKAVTNFASWALLPPSGYQILVDFRATETPARAPATPPAAKDGAKSPSAKDPSSSTAYCVVVRIATRGRSKTLDVGTIDPAVVAIGVATPKAGTTAAAAATLRAASATTAAPAVTDDDVLRAAGYWAAGWILSNCKLVPSWSVWSAGAGRPLGRFRSKVKSSGGVLDDLSSLATEKKREAAIDAAIAPLETARVADPDSGVVLTQLAEQYEFKNDFVNALEINLQVVRLYPRYYVARYRTAIGLSMLVSSGSQPWQKAKNSPDGQGDRILALLREIEACGNATDAIVNVLEKSGASSPEAKHCFSLLSGAQLQQGRKLAKARWMMVMSLRKDERRFWLSRLRRPLLIRHTLGSALPSIQKAGYNSKLTLKAVPNDLGPRLFFEPRIGRVTRWAASRNESAQVLYNLACYHAYVPGAPPGSPNVCRPVEAARDELGTAIRLLERTQTHPYADQIHASWVQRDPDLVWLRRSSCTPTEVRVRYERLIALMSGAEAAQKARD
jgi:hypothetical protein